MVDLIARDATRQSSRFSEALTKSGGDGTWSHRELVIAFAEAAPPASAAYNPVVDYETGTAALHRAGVPPIFVPVWPKE
ncbi:hypothetical protein MN608_02050 [Microdochium nivale]|nr:hypothetical protein MN608_02050 [Microdochium nivale]